MAKPKPFRSAERRASQSNWQQQPLRAIKMQIALNATKRTHRLLGRLLLAAALQTVVVLGQQAGPSFPGVTRDLASFCSARPSLSIDLAPMIVHVKRNTSFNYKLYLFSQDEHIFQTGQIVPRDDFRIHSFPVKLKHLDEFMGSTRQDANLSRANSAAGPKVFQTIREDGRDANSRGGRSRLVRVPSSQFDFRRFFARVQLDELEAVGSRFERLRSQLEDEHKISHSKHQTRALPFDVQGDALPGDGMHLHHNQHDAALASNGNEHIEFDRDDQLAILDQPVASRLHELNRRHASRAGAQLEPQAGSHLQQHQSMVMPVGSFSAFHVNTTYLARKDFGQTEAELIRLEVDARNFQVERVDLLRPLLEQEAAERMGINTTSSNVGGDLSEDEFAFLSHRLLRDRNVRLTSISQIYEDWITRNHYTIVYIQRRLTEPATGLGADADELEHEDNSGAGELHERSGPRRGSIRRDEPQVVTERLIFRGSSIVLLGADQLDYHVKASAFITEKNGLHYFLEFLPNGKFHLGAIDWSKRPFKFIDSQHLPIKPTQTQFDNEELLLCPPSVCYSERPIDELVAYGRLPLPAKLQSEATILSKSSSLSAPSSSTVMPVEGGVMVLPAEQLHGNGSAETSTTTTTSHQSESISLDNLIEAVRVAAAASLDLRLHLRDWTWQLAREPNRLPSGSSHFLWHYERARRNELKAVPDTYGFALVGHEIDASYRVFNELYLISAGNLIGIDYTLANETATSVRPIGDEFPGLSSNLLDPITGAFYDRYSNQIYFFKGDRYVGYDYATKKPLEDFLLPPAVDDTLGGLNLALLMQPAGSRSQTGETLSNKRGSLVSSLPVAEILGQQHQVDAIYHDLGEDLVYVFAGMRFYALKASDFKDGAFRHNAASKRSTMLCINEHFLVGCRFDAAYPNPCHSDKVETAEPRRPVSPETRNPADSERPKSEHDGKQVETRARQTNNFSEEQQMKLRSIAARGGATVGLMDFLLENTIVAQGAGREPAARLRSAETEQIVVYLLVAMVLVTVLATVAMIMVVLNWARLKSPDEFNEDRGKASQRNKMAAEEERRGGGAAQRMTERLAYPPAIAHYLNSQYQQQQQRPPSLAGYFYNGAPASATGAGARRLANYAASSGPLTAPPTLPPPPAPRRSELVDSSMF